jgi:chromosome segregation protein
MTFIKKLVMHGFKSFPRKTELPFTQGINVILGPNGSGKSNISDALCFVLGRLSIKSMRATKASNLLFLGSKIASPSKEASVEIIFDNSDRTFSIEAKDISIKRVVRRNGQSIYKLNNETKTRQDILGILAQAGIDPNGYNIILQGEIQNLVRMQSEERRKIIEEVSGISIYESRKEKSLKELDKTEEKLKEVLAILRERTAYLNNLEKERQQALRFKKLEKDAKRFKAGIIYFDLIKKQKELEKVNLEISSRLKEIEKTKKIILELSSMIKNFELRIENINKIIHKSTGFEQEKLNQEIADIRAVLAGLEVNQNNSEKKMAEISRQKISIHKLIKEHEIEIKRLQKETPSVEKKSKDISSKKQELERIEEQRKRFYMVKSELKSVKERLEDKKKLFSNFTTESDFLLQEIKSISLELFDIKSNPNKLEELKKIFSEKKNLLQVISKQEIEFEKLAHTNEHEIENKKKLLEKISKIDICPVCKSKITESHINSITKETTPEIERLQKEIENADKNLGLIYDKRKIIQRDIEQITSEISKRESDIVKLTSIKGKKEQIKNLQEKIDSTKKEILELEKRKKNLEKIFDENSNIEQKYETARIEVQEMSLLSEETISSEISFKQRELERLKISFKQLCREEEDVKEESSVLQRSIRENGEILEKKKKQEEILGEKFKKLISERDSIHSQIREREKEKINQQGIAYNFEQAINEFKINKARVDAEISSLESEMLSFSGVEIIKSNRRELLVEKLAKIQDILSRIGSVNLRSLEVYDSVKEEYDSIKDKVGIISNEKEGIMKIIHEIDIKKKKTFLKTLNELNEIFSRNFIQLSTKGNVYLELENRKEPFEGGVGIIVKTGHGKYFDVKSLSGGEQTLVALSLIFAIQELNPYYFYVLDEIDAALDKKNSERLAGLLKRYMKKGQYIVITHNDEVITNATSLYGVSMHEGISKIISLKI